VQVAAATGNAAFAYKGPLQAFTHICRTEGFRAFYRGSVFAYAKVVPSIGAMYMLYELSSQALAIGGLRRCAMPARVLHDAPCVRLACAFARQWPTDSGVQ
jgi:Mitochondrial carrier protein